MNNRIRYNKVNDRGVITSRRSFSTDSGRQITVELDTTNKTFKIFDDRTREVLAAGGKTTNMNILKMQAKYVMEQMGVSFEKEDRIPRRRSGVYLP